MAVRIHRDQTDQLAYDDSVELSTPEAIVAQATLDMDASSMPRPLLEPVIEQPHLRAQRPPFWPTHAARETMDGIVDWQPAQHAIMVIEGFGYSPGAWEAGQGPRFDVDVTGAWYDLEAGHHLSPSEQPEMLPARYGMWRDPGGTPHLAIAEDGSITEIAVKGTAVDAILADLVADIPAGWEAVDALAVACTDLSTDVRELAVTDIEDLFRGDRDALTPYTWTRDALGTLERTGAALTLTNELGAVEPAGTYLVAMEQQALAIEPADDLSDALWDF